MKISTNAFLHRDCIIFGLCVHCVYCTLVYRVPYSWEMMFYVIDFLKQSQRSNAFLMFMNSS